MKTKGFTLIELLVVIALIGVLIAILMPQLSAARSMTRTALCHENLKQIHGAFQGSAGMSGTGGKLYSDPKRWPGKPYDAMPEEKVFICPEDNPGEWNLIDGLKYRSVWGGTPPYFVAFEEGAKSPVNGAVVARARRGSDPQKGPYWEFVFEENYSWQDPTNGVCTDFWDRRPGYPNCSDYSDNDGLFRVYDDAPDYGRAATLKYFTCSLALGAFLFDEGLFEPSGNLGGHLGDMVPLSSFYTSYGINANVHAAQIKPSTIILTDIQAGKQDLTFIADPASPDLVKRLNDGARHRGKISTLRHDGSVQAVWPAEVYPSLNPKVWQTQP